MRKSEPRSTLLTKIPEHTVLVTGAGRSGTSWLGKLLDASPRVFYKHEPDNWTYVPWFRNIPSRLDDVPENDSYREEVIGALERSFWTHCLHFVAPPDFPKKFLRHRLWRLMNLGLRAHRKLGLGDGPSFTIPRWMFREDISQIHFVVKSVMSNLRLAWLHRNFPTFRLLLIIRHPGGYLSSWLRGARDHGWAGFGDKSRLNGTLLPFPRAEHEKYAPAYHHGSRFERELIYWIIVNETPLLELAESSALKVVVYEELCSDTEGVLRRVYEHCGIPLGESTKRFIEASTSKHQDGFYSVFKDPSRVAEQWREVLSSEQIETVDSYLAGSFLSKLWS